MISAQIDELRKWADQLSERENEFGVVVRALVAALRNAADTIWQLRDDLQRANTENAKLRTQLADVTVSMGRVEERCAKLRVERDEWHRVAVSKQDSIDHMRDANAENAKLRELVEDMHAALQAFCDAQDVHGDNCPLWVERTDDCELRGIERRMRELGIEVES